MPRDVLDVASKMLSRRDFPSAIKLLEGRSEIYEGNFAYYILLANACLYAGDAGTASMYYQKAREIKLTDTGLMELGTTIVRNSNMTKDQRKQIGNQADLALF